MSNLIIGVCMLFLLGACQKQADPATQSSPEPEYAGHKVKFTMMTPDQTGVSFVNSFKEDYNYNILTYEYLYNGGGVAAGDVNGDSLPDLYFSASFGSNHLYLNLGNFKFIDVTAASGTGVEFGFKTGVTMGDINGDGRLDIYSCRSSKSDDTLKNDVVLINMGTKLENGVQIPIFENQARILGLSDNSNTNHSLLIDYDRDGDMDIFLLNHRIDFDQNTQIRVKQNADGSSERLPSISSLHDSNKLYRNDNGRFTEVTEKAGLTSSAFALSATAADLNQDGWMDIYVANDYIEPDRVYINNQDGTYTDRYFEYLKNSSQNSMGSDISDINNDGLVDIIVMDMKPEDPIRYKSLMNVMSFDRYQLLQKYGYGRQKGRNVLQLNNGNNTFSEIAQYSGVSATDWSWGALMADFNNDGWKDIHIANGYRRDVTDFDYLNFTRDSLNRSGKLSAEFYPDINDILNIIPEKKTANYLYFNTGKLKFVDMTKSSGMDQVAFSNGTAYADLDRDGDLDIIVNNVLDPAFIYRNDIKDQNWLQIDVVEPKGNTQGIGAVAEVFAGDLHQHQMLMTNKGFFSSSEAILHFGLGDQALVDSIIFQFPDGSMEIMKSVKTNQRIIWKRGTGMLYKRPAVKKQESLFVNKGFVPGFIHQENEFVDFKRERLMPYMLSFEGPCISTGDMNGDQLEDIFVGNGSGFPASVYMQTAQSTFQKATGETFKNDALFEDCGSVLEDMDADNDLDLVVISGGNSFNMNDPAYMVRYYLNDGKGAFAKSPNFPIIRTNAGSILAFDYDKDSDQDLFIAGKSIPGSFPLPPKSYLLRNDQGKFVDVTADVFPELGGLGMISDMDTGDLDADGALEIVITGDWMPIHVFSFQNNKFVNRTQAFGLNELTGWWKSIEVVDIDGDQDADIVAGNLGLNHRMQTSTIYPITLITNDFDGNGSQDPILSFYHNGKLYPFAGRDALIGQIPSLKKKYLRYKPYASATIDDIFPKDKLEEAFKLQVSTFLTVLLINDNKKFISKELPYQTQLSPVYDIVVRDFNGDGMQDLLMAGNFLYSETETAEMDGGIGTLLLQNADKSFRYMPNAEHGFWAQEEVRELKFIKLASGDVAVLTGNNKGPVEMHIVKKEMKVVQ